MKRKQSQFMLLHEKGALWKQGAFFFIESRKGRGGGGKQVGEPASR